MATLASLQRRHLLSIPFENLDIHWGQRITLDTRAFYDKIVAGGRGGFCYELNGLFNELLRQIGFETRLVSARVFRDDGSLGPEFDHAAIIVDLDKTDYLVDVGFGDFATEPLSVSTNGVQNAGFDSFKIEIGEADALIVSKRINDVWVRQYSFGKKARHLYLFRGMD